MIYDVIVLGGGIAGLYTAYTLHHQNPKLSLLLLEKNDYFGGRIYTIHEKEFTIEAGAGRWNETHILWQQLIRELGLQEKIQPIPSDLHFVPSGNYASKYFNCDPFETMNPVLSKAKQTPRDKLREYTFMEFAQTVLSPQDCQFVEDSFGYYEQLMCMNAYDATKLFDQGMHTKHSFFVLKGGMSQVIDKLVSKLTHKICKKNQTVTKITYPTTTNTTTNTTTTTDHLFHIEVESSGKTNTYFARQCVAALPKPALQSIPFFKPIYPLLSHIGTKTLCRIYAQFSQENIWFKHIPKSTTNNRLRYVIPIDRDKGVIMISYTDGKYARYWKDKDDASIIDRVKKQIYQTYDFKIEDPVYIRKCYWELGTSYWKPNVRSFEICRKLIQPIPTCPMFLCGETYSTNQGWIEGALETSRVVIDKLLL